MLPLTNFQNLDVGYQKTSHESMREEGEGKGRTKEKRTKGRKTKMKMTVMRIMREVGDMFNKEAHGCLYLRKLERYVTTCNNNQFSFLP